MQAGPHIRNQKCGGGSCTGGEPGCAGGSTCGGSGVQDGGLSTGGKGGTGDGAGAGVLSIGSVSFKLAGVTSSTVSFRSTVACQPTSRV
ncbi:MAG: hypothetical protein EOO27_27120 [Comamonadaceae bacterium]|nr:MAG: hypothetical protein EOO27_27120 [Comamonadaceae bacterium]